MGAVACSDALGPNTSPEPAAAAEQGATSAEHAAAAPVEDASAAPPREHSEGSGPPWLDGGTRVAADSAYTEPPPPDAGPEAPPHIRACHAPIQGDGPFGISLLGSAFAVRAYFPQGRTPGAPVLFAFPTSYVSGLVVQTATITADRGSTPFIAHDRPCGINFSGMWVGPDDGFQGTFTRNTSGPGDDVLRTESSEVMLCASALPLPAPSLTVSSSPQLPTQAIRLVPSAPIDKATLSSIRVQGRELVVTTRDDGQLSASPAQGAFAPGPLAIDVSGVRDVLGRKVTDSLSVEIPVPTKSIAGLSFDKSPPAGSIVAIQGSVGVANGKLRLEGNQLAALIGLGSAPQTSKLRIKHSVVCLSDVQRASVSLVASDGTEIALPATCGSAELSVALSGKAPYFLAVQAGGEGRPCSLPPVTAPAYEIEAISFAP